MDAADTADDMPTFGTPSGTTSEAPGGTEGFKTLYFDSMTW